MPPTLPPGPWTDPLGLARRVPATVDGWVGSVLGSVRESMGDTLRARVAGPDAVAQREAILGAPGEPWFPEDSPVRVVHADAAMFVGGLLAVLRQTVHPRAMAGVAQHSRYREDPWGRLHRTGRFLGAVSFGSREVAEQAIASVRRIHDRVTGIDRDGRPYAAGDPHLLLWVHCAELESFVTAHRAYGTTRLTPADYDRYVADMASVGEALGAEP